MTAFAPVFSRGLGCKYRPKKAPRTKAATMLIMPARLSFAVAMLARLGFAVAVAFIAGALLGLIPLTSEAPQLAEATLLLHQQKAQDNSAVALDSVSRHAARVVTAKPKASRRASKQPTPCDTAAAALGVSALSCRRKS
jgi:hypothetical protein